MFHDTVRYVTLGDGVGHISWRGLPFKRNPKWGKMGQCDILISINCRRQHSLCCLRRSCLESCRLCRLRCFYRLCCLWICTYCLCQELDDIVPFVPLVTFVPIVLFVPAQKMCRDRFKPRVAPLFVIRPFHASFFFLRSRQHVLLEVSLFVPYVLGSNADSCQKQVSTDAR